MPDWKRVEGGEKNVKRVTHIRRWKETRFWVVDTAQSMGHVLQNCILETYIIFVTHVTSINLIKILKKKDIAG